MHRRGVGVGAIKRRAAERAKFEAVGGEMAAAQAEHVEQQVAAFRTHLEAFALKHKRAINRDPEFRQQFQKMCASIGVDPLVSSKGFWAELLGFGDFYFELGVQVIDACLSTRNVNGGLMDMQELRARVTDMRSAAAQAVSEDDLRRAITHLRALGNGFGILRAGGRELVVSVPCELSQDHTDVLLSAQRTGFVTVSQLHADFSWPPERARRALQLLLDQGMAWVDVQGGEPQYWFLSVWACRDAAAATAADA